jgi:hypothetical protein
VTVISWVDLSVRRPDLTEAGQALLYQFGVGLAFLGTLRCDGAPRVHPIAPLLHTTGLYGFLSPSRKLDDLKRDPRYALHTYPRPNDEDAFYVSGRALFVPEGNRLQTLREAYLAERPATPPPNLTEQAVVELLIDRCLLTRTRGHGDFAPRHTIWRTDP